MAEFSMDKMAKAVAERAMEELKENGVFVGVWTSVSEGLPKSHGVYNVTRLIDEAYITNSCFYDGSTWYDDTRINHSRKYLNDIIAWMPRPEPYKKGESE